ncbi:MAG: hypothetical protein R8K47_08285 [Mariprofundaceae bacterium]
MKKRGTSSAAERLLALACAAALLGGCGQWDRLAVSRVLDARDAAITAQDIGAYSILILDAYRDERGRSKVQLIAEMLDLFDRFEKTEMHAFDRACRLSDETHALCEQSYKLRVLADGDWREIVQREQLALTRTASGWKISGGL